MRVFEFHFGAKQKDGLTFDTFCFEPENFYEKRVGSLYMAGFLKNALPQNARLLNNIAKTIEEKYYKLSLKNPELALKESLKSANEFLDNVSKKGDVSWLGNLSFAVLSLKNFELNFTKVGGVKIVLLRNGHIIDIDKRLQTEGIEPYPLKVFPNIISGKLAENDLILVLTKDVFNSFQSQRLIGEISQIAPFREKALKDALKRKSEALSKIQGVCLMLYLSKDELTSRKETLSPQKQTYLKKFSFKNALLPLIPNFSQLFKKFNLHKKIGIPKLKLPKKIKISRGIKLNLSKKIILPVFLALFLTVGFLISKAEENKKLKAYEITFSQIEEKVNQAENFLILRKTRPDLERQAAGLFNDAWEKISPLVKISSDFPEGFKQRVSALQEKISKNLLEINKLIKIDEPELLFEASPKLLVAQKITFDEKDIYIFSPFSQNIFKISADGKQNSILEKEKYNLAVKSGGSVLFFQKPDKFTILKDGAFSQGDISLPPDFNPDLISSFDSNFYFYNKETGDIVKNQQAWLFRQAKRTLNAKSMAVSGSIWLLNGDDSISRYYAGNFQENITPAIFPQSKNFTKILAVPNLAYLYLLEPEQNRLVVIDRTGSVVKQFQSKKFDNLLDFAVSNNGKTIYLLNNQKVYKILF